jgi:hypothetical protein
MTTFDRIRERLRLAVIYGMFLTDEERVDLDRELEEVVAAIAECETIDDAENKMEDLDQMQLTLATICYKYRIDLTEKQDWLVRQCERWDDDEVRSEIFEAIKQRQFP